MSIRCTVVLSAVLLIFMSACEDQGDPVSPPVVPANAPIIVSLTPDSGAVGDTIAIKGSKFGTTQGSGIIRFGTLTAAAASWNDTLVRAVVPVNAATSNVTVVVNGNASNGKQFKLLGIVLISYTTDIVPIFNDKGCAGCHGGSGGLTVIPYSSLIAGNSSHGPVITAGNGEGSVIVRKLRGTAGFGSRMPQGSPALSETEIQKIVKWIDQGALNN